ncbi:MAG: hypothetical protein ACRD12_13110 [Acidimicrobiales bacterium]
MTMGPVQLVVVSFDEPEFRGEIIAELERLKEADIVRVVDALAIYKDDAGDVAILQFSDLSTDEATEYGATVGALIGLGVGGEEGAELGALLGAEAGSDGHVIDEGNFIDVIEEIPNGSAAAIVLLEHRWAVPLREIIARQGGTPIIDSWVHPLDLIAVGILAGDEAEAEALAD